VLQLAQVACSPSATAPPGSSAVVYADVVAGGAELALEIVTGRCQQGHQVGALGVRDFEERA